MAEGVPVAAGLTGNVLLVHGLEVVSLAGELRGGDTQLDELVEDLGEAVASRLVSKHLRVHDN